MDNLFFDGMKYGIVIFSLIMFYAEVAQALQLRRIRKLEIRLRGQSDINYIWVKWWLGACGLYWAGYYILLIFHKIEGLPLHQVWVRGPLLITIALIASGALMSLRRVR